MKTELTPHSWESRNAKAKRLINLLKQGQKVTRWEMFPVRFICLDMAQGNEELLHEINLLIDETKGSL